MNRSKSHWRPMEDRDIPALKAMHERRNAALGMSEPFPDLDGLPFFLKAVCERGGEILGALFFEMQAEVISESDNPEFMGEAAKFWPALQQALRLRNIHTVHCRVPRNVEGRSATRKGHSAFFRRRGFVDVSEQYSSYVTEI